MFVWRRRSAPGALALMCFLLCVAVWNAGYGIEILSAGREDKLFWAKAEYPGVFLLPVAFFAFSVEHSGRRAWARAGRLATARDRARWRSSCSPGRTSATT